MICQISRGVRRPSARLLSSRRDPHKNCSRRRNAIIRSKKGRRKQSSSLSKVFTSFFQGKQAFVHWENESNKKIYCERCAASTVETQIWREIGFRPTFTRRVACLLSTYLLHLSDLSRRHKDALSLCINIVSTESTKETGTLMIELPTRDRA